MKLILGVIMLGIAFEFVVWVMVESVGLVASAVAVALIALVVGGAFLISG